MKVILMSSLTQTPFCSTILNIDVSRNTTIRALNDRFRTGTYETSLPLGQVVVSAGIRSLGPRDVVGVVEAVMAFDAFTPDNDPYGEHDFGAFDYKGHPIIWKIDYFDRDYHVGSPAPSNVKVTRRLLTITLADEY